VGAGQSPPVPYTATSGVNYRSEPNGLNVPPTSGAFMILPTGANAPSTLESFVKSLDECVVGSVNGCLSSNAALKTAFLNPTQNPTYGFTLIPEATSVITAGSWQVQDGGNTFTITFAAGRLNLTNSAKALLASVNASPALVEALDGVGPAAPISAAFPTISAAATVSVSSPRSWSITNGIYTLPVSANNIVGGKISTALQVLYVINASTNSPLIDYSGFLFNSPPAAGQPANAPQTPIFCAEAGQKVRFRVVQPGTDGDQAVEIHGHSWPQEPYISGGTQMAHNPNSQQLGTQVISPNDRLDLVIASAGGAMQLPGDYLYHGFMSQLAGMWGIFRVTPQGSDPVQACTHPAAPTTSN
jgi:hypothetical protein